MYFPHKATQVLPPSTLASNCAKSKLRSISHFALKWTTALLTVDKSTGVFNVTKLRILFPYGAEGVEVIALVLPLYPSVVPVHVLLVPLAVQLLNPSPFTDTVGLKYLVCVT